MSSLNFLRSRRGFSIVSIVVAFGLMGILALVFTKLLNNGFKGQSTVEKQSQQSALFAFARNLLVSSSGCKASLVGGGSPLVFGGSAGGYRSVTLSDGLFLGDSAGLRVGAAQLKIGQDFGNLKLTEIKLRVPSGVVPATGTNNTIADLEISAHFGGDAFGGKDKDSLVKIPIKIDSTAKIVGCEDTAAGTSPATTPFDSGPIALGDMGDTNSTGFVEVDNPIGQVPSSVEWVLECMDASCGGGYVPGDTVSMSDYTSQASYLTKVNSPTKLRLIKNDDVDFTSKNGNARVYLSSKAAHWKLRVRALP